MPSSSFNFDVDLDLSTPLSKEVREGGEEKEQDKERKEDDFACAVSRDIIQRLVQVGREGQGDGRAPSSSSSSSVPPPCASYGTPAPSWAKTYYKIVALSEDNRVLSVYDGKTEYSKNKTLYQRIASCSSFDNLGSHGDGFSGGFYVYDTVQECLKAHELFPKRSAGAGAAKRVARVLAWNSKDDKEGGKEEEEQGACFSYGHKKVFSHVRLVEVLPVPAGDEALAPREVTGPRQERRLSVIRARANTIALKEEVQRMEEKLRVTRLIRTSTHLDDQLEVPALLRNAC